MSVDDYYFSWDGASDHYAYHDFEHQQGSSESEFKKQFLMFYSLTKEKLGKHYEELSVLKVIFDVASENYALRFQKNLGTNIISRALLLKKFTASIGNLSSATSATYILIGEFVCYCIYCGWVEPEFFMAYKRHVIFFCQCKPVLILGS